MSKYWRIILINVFGFFYRCRGGFLGLNSTQAARIVWWGIPCGLWAYAATGNAWAGLWTGVLAVASVILIDGNAAFQNGATIDNTVGMAGTALLRTTVTLVPVIFLYHWTAAALPLALLAGPGYYFSEKYLDKIPSGITFSGLRWSSGFKLGDAKVLGGTQLVNPGQFATGGSEWGEVMYGEAVGFVFLAATLIIMLLSK